MLSAQQLMNFTNSNVKFIEDNLLDSDDWTGNNNDLFDLVSRDDGSPSSSSLDSDQTSYTDYSPTSLHSDDISDWLQEDILHLQSSQLYDVSIKEEPQSPPIDPNKIIVQNTPHIIFPLTGEQTVPEPKVPIGITQTCMQVATTSAPIRNTAVNLTTPLPTNVTPVTSNVLTLNNIAPLPMKTKQLNTALLPREKYTVPPKIVKLENGQFYIARSVIKTPKEANLQVGQKRQATVAATVTKDYTDLKNMKRQQRMMKNRESACLSRQRKKEHVQTLEVKVNEINTINAQLKEENRKLRERISELESENNLLKGTPASLLKGNARKSTTLVMAVLLFVIFNPFKFSAPPLNDQHLRPKSTIFSTHRGRKLLQYDNSNINYDIDDTFDDFASRRKSVKQMLPDLQFSDMSSHQKGDVLTIRRKYQQQLLKKPLLETTFSSALNKDDFVLDSGGSSDFPAQDIDCEETFNKTHLTRINRVLQGFVNDFDKENTNVKKRAKRRRNLVKPRKMKFPKLLHQHNCNTSTHEEPLRPLISPLLRAKERKPTEKDSVPRNTSQELFNELKRSIHRKPDTFYVVSVKDFLVLPATNYSLDHRLKFSFMLPTLLQTGNETSMKDDNNLSLLQIDCSVLDTKLVRLNKKNLRPNNFS